MRSRRTRLVAAVCALGTAALAGCSDAGASGSGKVELALVAYSTPQEAYTEIIKAYQETPQGKDVTFTQSYGASGDQSRAVAAGLPADVVAFSLEPDMTRLVDEDIVAPDWNKGVARGMVTDSVAAIATRKGNPDGIEGWDDLTAPGVEVITPNPFTSGGARWNVMAAYGAASGKGRDKAAGVDYLKSLFANVPVQDDSARKSLQTFTGGKGDALIAYENEAIFAQAKGQPLDYVVPDDTILIENPVAATKTSDHPVEAKAFVDFLHSEQAQKIFADNGYRPTLKRAVAADAFPKPANLFTIKDLGGWSKVTEEFFDPTGSVMADVERELGVSVEK